MTRDEILAEPAGRELDNLVALRVMGYKFPTFEEMKETAEEQWKDQPSCIHFFRGFDAWLEDGEFKWKYNSKSYSTDISAAWEVVEKFDFPEIKVQLRNHEGPSLWKCILADGWATGRTAPEAICKASLIAVMEGQAHDL
jgi:hypothetical protein